MEIKTGNEVMEVKITGSNRMVCAYFPPTPECANNVVWAVCPNVAVEIARLLKRSVTHHEFGEHRIDELLQLTLMPMDNGSISAQFSVWNGRLVMTQVEVLRLAQEFSKASSVRSGGAA